MLELTKGTQLANRYSLVRRLGDGGQAEVWLARDRMTRASVALKLVAQAGADQLRREWQAALRLMHAHTVRVFEFHSDEQVAFYSQQYIDGPQLGVLTGRPAAEVLGPIGLLADALRYLHGKGVVHRDLKATNVLLDGNGAPYLGDFGSAVRIGEAGAGGSPIAQSPESVAGQPATAADDIFALGSLIYELLSGRSPWAPDAVEESIRAASPPPLQAADGSPLPEAVIALVGSMLDPDAANRPDAEAVAVALRDAGFPARAAAVKGKAQIAADEEIVESKATIRPLQRPTDTPTPAPAAESSGFSARTVYVALGVLVAVLLGVVFLLPDRVEEMRDSEDEPAPVVVIEPEEVAAPVVVDRPQGESGVYVDPEIRARIDARASVPTRTLEGDEDITFSENQADYSGLDQEARDRMKAELALGELLSAFEVLEGRGIELWAPVEHGRARDLYEEGDRSYLDKLFVDAEDYYLGALTVLEPTYALIEPMFEQAYAAGQAAFDAGDRATAMQQFELAVAITPTHSGALAGLRRARNLEAVLQLVEQGEEYEEDLDFVAAVQSYERAIELDEQWQPAHDGLVRVRTAQTKIEFDTRMSEGFESLISGDYLGARAAFRMAQRLIPESTEPADGLLQVDQGLRMQQITTLEQEAQSLEQDEHWDAVIRTYEEILNVDNSLVFASDGLAYAREMSALHARLDGYIEDPDKLSAPATMQQATSLVVSITTRGDVGPRLAAQRDELSRLLKRAATALTVSLVSDNMTEVAVYRVGRLGTFMRREVQLRPGTYVAVGSRAGYRDVRLEFRVAPELDMQPVIIQCEEPI